MVTSSRKPVKNASEKSSSLVQKSPTNSSRFLKKPHTHREKVKRRAKIVSNIFGLLFSLAIFGVWNYYHTIIHYFWIYSRNVQDSSISEKQVKTVNLAPVNTVNISRGIERRSNLSIDDYVKLYDAKWPVLVTDTMRNWLAMKKWSTEFFAKHYGEKWIYFHGVQGELKDREGLSSPLWHFLQHIDQSAPNTWAYIGDEIFLMRHPELRRDVETPTYIKDDYFSLFPEEIRPWNLMLLWGSRFSRSTLHIDPYNWTGTNAVIKGRKSWKLYPPGQDHLLYVLQGRRCGFPLDCIKYQSEADSFDYDPSMYPLLKEAKVIEFDQYPGEMLFIPTGWFHQAYNKEETLAVSSQVMNNQNYREVLNEMIKGGSIPERKLPNDFASMSPHDQVKTAISTIPDRVLQRGRRVNREQILQVEKHLHGIS